ncbi:MAG TPA: transglutaminase family protein [Myxococcota bacterium]|nr:transglutaminase family protein [Myxococcota bacterium]
MDPELAPYLAPGPTVESAHPAVVDFARAHAKHEADAVKTAVALYYAVRDGIRYDPYSAVLTTDGLRASGVLATGRGWCVPKAVLLAAACRSRGIPARLGFADVRNHLSTARLREQMQSEVFYWHGYTSIHLDGRWVKVTPAFNIELCTKFVLLPLEFEGRSDSLYPPFDRAGKRHMEYLRGRGEHADVPLDAMLATFREKYPHMYGGAAAAGAASLGDADFSRDVEKEIADAAAGRST